MRYRARVDSNHKQIKALFQQFAVVKDTSKCGFGTLDLQVQYNGELYFIEIKSKTGKLTPEQREFINSCPNSAVVRSPEDVILFINDFQQLRNKTLKELCERKSKSAK